MSMDRVPQGISEVTMATHAHATKRGWVGTHHNYLLSYVSQRESWVGSKRDGEGKHKRLWNASKLATAGKATLLEFPADDQTYDFKNGEVTSLWPEFAVMVIWPRFITGLGDLLLVFSGPTSGTVDVMSSLWGDALQLKCYYCKSTGQELIRTSAHVKKIVCCLFGSYWPVDENENNPCISTFAIFPCTLETQKITQLLLQVSRKKNFNIHAKRML